MKHIFRVSRKINTIKQLKVINYRNNNKICLPQIYSKIHQQKSSIQQLNYQFIKKYSNHNAKAEYKSIENKIEGLYEYIKNTIMTVEPNNQFIRQSIHYYFSKSGKLMRPTMLHLLNSNFDKDHQFEQKIKKWGALIEILHIASLAHDDVIDDSPARRGMQSQHVKFGKKLAIFGGNYIIGKASKKISEFNDINIYKIYAQMMDNLAEGEVLQALKIRDWNNIQSMIQTYMDKTYFKTAALISNSFRAVPIFHNLDEESQLNCFKIGQHLGIAFQLIDDILDYTGNAVQMGKQTLSDLVQGNITGPILFCLLTYKKDPKIYNYLKEILKQRNIQKEKVLIVNQYLKKTNGIELTRHLAILHVEQALKSLNKLNVDEKQKQIWRYLSLLILQRKK